LLVPEVMALVILLSLALTCFRNMAVQMVVLEMGMGRNMTEQMHSLGNIYDLMVVADSAGLSNLTAGAGWD
jgi:hypothetical protein